MRASVRFLAFAVLLAACSRNGDTGSNEPTEPAFDPTVHVDPFIGTGGHGHTYPGATMPFGMVQLSPDTRLTGWDGCGGYHYTDTLVYGFSHTHLSGTGISDYGDILLMPTTAQMASSRPAPGADADHPFAARFTHGDEDASPGFYRVHLPDTDTEVELTTTLRTGIHRYTFAEGASPAVFLDLRHRDRVTSSGLRRVGESGLSGHRHSTQWARDQQLYFAIEFSRPIVQMETVGGQDASESGPRTLLHFAPGNAPLLAKVGISAVDEAGARKNLEAEAPHWDFDQYLADAKSAWRDSLGRIEVEGGTPAQRTIFYTSLYHAMVVPNLYEDVDRRYRGIDRKVHTSTDHTNYTVFSLWDTFRSAHPLYNLIERERSVDFVKTLLEHHKQGGRLSMWELAGNYTDTMIGYHAASVIADAHARGIQGFDVNQALDAMVATADMDLEGRGAYAAHNFLPSDAESQSVSRTLEYAYDDWCVAEVAQSVGREDIAKRFYGRAQSWENVFDPDSGLMRPRINGGFFTPFDPRQVNSHYTEANAWQYGFFVPHDVGGLVARHGGKEQLASRLDQLFTQPTETTGNHQADITGLIGQYAHGNEPSHHIAYLYPYTGNAPKGQARIREIMDELYTVAPDGLSGNEDCGQMSAWYVLSAMGLFAMNPGSDEWVLGTPLFPRTTIHLENGQDFVIEARDVSERNYYVQNAVLNGAAHETGLITQDDIANGGQLIFQMGDRPNPAWGAIEPAAPLHAGAHAVLPAPVASPIERSFDKSMTLTLAAPVDGGTIHYTLDGSEPTVQSPRYAGPVTIEKTTQLRAIVAKGGQTSAPIQAAYNLRPEGRSITLNRAPNRLYTAGGPVGLVDGVKGTENWRAGTWQGHQGYDLEAVIDLGKVRPISKVTAGFLQDARAWILMPSGMEVEVSRDGKTYKPVGKATHDVPAKTDEIVTRDLEVEFARTRARYVRVRAMNPGPLPDWHLGAGGASFIFVDEFDVN